MATQKLNLTRDQLATFLKNHEQIRQFERLFQVADEVSPATDTEGISIEAGNADASANEALAQIVSLARDVAINGRQRRPEGRAGTGHAWPYCQCSGDAGYCAGDPE